MANDVDSVSEIAARLRAGLEGVTPGPWFTCGLPWFRTGSGVLCGSPDPHVGFMIVDTEGFEGERDEYEGPLKLGDPAADARHIANCSPENIRAILDENERLDQLANDEGSEAHALRLTLLENESRLSQLEQQLSEARMYLERLCECGIVMIAEHRNAARAFLNKDTPHD